MGKYCTEGKNCGRSCGHNAIIETISEPINALNLTNRRLKPSRTSIDLMKCRGLSSSLKDDVDYDHSWNIKHTDKTWNGRYREDISRLCIERTTLRSHLTLYMCEITIKDLNILAWVIMMYRIPFLYPRKKQRKWQFSSTPYTDNSE